MGICSRLLRLDSRRVSVASLGLVAALALSCGPARASSLDAAGTKIIAFADTRMTPTKYVIPSQLTMLKTMYCSRLNDPGAPLSLNGALAVARGVVAGDSGGRGLQAFARSRYGRKESTAIAAAAGALSTGKPAAALAALLRAHQLKPLDPVPLIDAAPLLSQAGKGRAALGLLDAAKRLKAPKTDPFGISWSALMTANRGQALIVTRQYALAEKTLAAALKSAPLLREAEQNMAVAYDCQGNAEQATRYMIAAVQRQTFQRGDYLINNPIDPVREVNAAEVLDTSKGTTLTLQTINYPQTMAAGKAQRFAYLAAEQNFVDQVQPAAMKRRDDDQAALTARLKTANPATRQRTFDIVAAVGTAASEPDLAALNAKAYAAGERLGQLQLESFTQLEGCANHGLHGAWLTAVQDNDRAVRAFAGALYRRQTALAANLRNPLAHQVGLDTARLDALQNYFSMLDAGNLIAIYDYLCDDEHVIGTALSTSGTTQTPPSLPCPSGIGGLKFAVDLLVFAFSVNCEEVTFEGKVGEGWLNAVGSFTHSFKNGSNTIFVGAQAGVKAPGIGPLSGGPSARGGVYATFGADGSFQDIGLRGSTSASVKVGSVSAKISGPGTSISLAGAFSSL